MPHGRQVLILFVAGAALLCGQAARASTIYDVGADWSYTSNPNGVWSYNQGTTPLPSVVPNWGGVPGETFWAGSYPPVPAVTPAWGMAATAMTGDIAHWAPGDVIGHSTNFFGVAANITWTSPGDGTIGISGEAWDANHDAGRDDMWKLLIGGVLIAERGSVFGIARSDGTAQFANNLQPGKSLSGYSVAPGDTVVFEIDALTSYGHFVGVDLTINYDNGAATPEPSTTAESLIGVLCGVVLAGIRKRRRS